MSEEDKNKDVLVVASKLKKYIKDSSGMNTSGAVVDVLSERIRNLCSEAIQNAKTDGRNNSHGPRFPTVLIRTRFRITARSCSRECQI